MRVAATAIDSKASNRDIVRGLSMVRNEFQQRNSLHLPGMPAGVASAVVNSFGCANSILYWGTVVALYAKISCTTFPATSVRRSLRPLWK